VGRTFIIAEAGSCHDGSLEKALRLVGIAAARLADAVKFQFWSSAEALAERRHAPEYVETYERYQLPAEWLPELKARADALGIEFMCTTYLPGDIATVAPFVRRFKVASFELGDGAFLAAHERFGKPVIASTGMASDDEAYYRPAVPRFDVLHCVSAYPAPIEDLNLSLLTGPPFTGFSDHSRHLLAGAIAVACGARILEVHFRASDTDPDNPDFLTAFSAFELHEYIQNVRDAERMLGDRRKRLMPSEVAMARYRVGR
jgi:N,N'-diacetyllegionaminate synthase